MSDFDIKNFINRDEEISRILKKVSGLVNGKPFAPKERVFHFIGPSGIGKSSLLEKCYQELVTKHSECVPLLVRLDALKGGKRGFFEDLLIVLYEDLCKHKKIESKKCDGQTRARIISFFNKTMEIYGNEQIIILLLDEVNIPSQKDRKEIEELFLVKLLTEYDNTILVTAGRSNLMWNNFILVSDISNTFSLPPFDDNKTREQMEHLKPGSGILATKVNKLGSGIPGNTVKLTEQITGNPLDIPNEGKVVQLLANEIKDKNKIDARFYPMLESISILQGFYPEDVTPLFHNHHQLKDGWDESRVKEVFQELCRIPIGPGELVDWDRDKKYWVMDERTRDLFEKELQIRDPELWKKLHCVALGMYQKWGEKYNSDMYRNKSNYHKQRLLSAGLNCSDLEG